MFDSNKKIVYQDTLDEYHKRISALIGTGGSQISTIPTASEDYENVIYQYIGTTDSTYTNGYFYKCIEDPENEGEYIWVNEQVQDGGSSGGGHEIEDSSGTTLTQRANLKFGGDFEVSDDSTNDATEVAPHELTNEDMAEIMSNPPGAFRGDGNPVGTIISFMGINAPYGYLKCDGTTYNISTYERLAGLFATQFGSSNYFGGDGTTTFAVPDLQGEFLRGSGTNSHANQGSGAGVGVHQDGTWINGLAGTSGIPYPNGNQYIGENQNADTIVVGVSRQYVYKGYDDSSGVIVTSRPTNTSVLYCIKY